MLNDRVAVANGVELQEILAEALQHVRVPKDYGVTLEGSIAEGFGNRTSDVDFLVVTQESGAPATLPVVLFIAGRRVEVRMRSAESIAAHAARINQTRRDTPEEIGRLSYDDLDVYQRFYRSTMLRNPTLIDRVKATHHHELFCHIAGAWYERQTRQGSSRASALLLLDQPLAASQWCRGALIAAGKAWSARQGETYLKDKWLDLQLIRAKMPAQLRDEFWRLVQGDGSSDLRAYVERCLGFVAELGVAHGAVQLSEIQLGQRNGVTTWQLGKQLSVLRGKSELFILGSVAARVWRAIVFSTPLATILTKTEIDPRTALECIAEFHRAGLIALNFPDGDSWIRTGSFPAALPNGPSVSLDGIRGLDVADTAVVLLAVGAVRLCFAACELAWANICLENGWEDLHGAFEREQWRVVQAALQSVMAWTCQVLYSAHGFTPPPDRFEIAARLSEIPDFDASIAALAVELRFICVETRAQAEAATVRVERFVELSRQSVTSSFFPASFESAEQWRQTLRIGFDWIRLASFIDESVDPEGRTFPIEEIREFVGARGSAARVESGQSTHGGARLAVRGRRSFAS